MIAQPLTGSRAPGAPGGGDLPPSALALCWHCGATADSIDPPGWVTVNPSFDPDVVCTAGVCPTCLADRYAVPAPRRTA